MVDKSLIQQLTEAYDRFFAHFDIDRCTGTVRGITRLKFATYPYIGSRYDQAKKILFVGLDIGQDETPNEFQSFDQRRCRIENKVPRNHNPHIAGTYVVATYLLRDQGNEWDQWYSTIDKCYTPKKILCTATPLTQNPLAYIALTNCYKFVDKGRSGRSGSKNRSFHDQKFEEDFLIEEVRILVPDVIICQGRSFDSQQGLMQRLSAVAPVYIGYHPAARGQDRQIGKLVESLRSVN